MMFIVINMIIIIINIVINHVYMIYKYDKISIFMNIHKNDIFWDLKNGHFLIKKGVIK